MGIARVFKKAEQPNIDKSTLAAWQVLNTSDVPELSLSLIFKKAVDGHVSVAQKNMAYMVISGSGTCEIDGVHHALNKGDVVYTPAGARYALSAGMELVAACTPRFGS
jgi:mannose-6-phosphate isomerase-like protein (cupin superfamily)